MSRSAGRSPETEAHFARARFLKALDARQAQAADDSAERRSLKSRAARWLRALVFTAMGFGSVAPFTECAQRQCAVPTLVTVSK